MIEHRAEFNRVYERIARRADELARFTDEARSPLRDLCLWRRAETEILVDALDGAPKSRSRG